MWYGLFGIGSKHSRSPGFRRESFHRASPRIECLEDRRLLSLTWNSTSLSLIGNDIGVSVTPNGQFFASSGFAINQSLNQGATWQAVTPSSSFAGGAIAYAPSNPTTMIAGSSHGTLKSVDGGTSWFEDVDLNAGPGANAIAFDPGNDLTVYAGVGDGWGLYKSTDGGATWTNPLSSTAVFAVAIDPVHTNVVYVGAEADSPYPGGLLKSGTAVPRGRPFCRM